MRSVIFTICLHKYQKILYRLLQEINRFAREYQESYWSIQGKMRHLGTCTNRGGAQAIAYKKGLAVFSKRLSFMEGPTIIF